MFNKIVALRDTFIKLKFIGLVLFAAILCFQPVFFAPTYIIGFFWLFYLLSFRPDRLVRLKHNKWFWAFTSFYIFYVLSLSWSENLPEGGRLVLLKITLFLWPLAFGSLSSLSKEHLKKILNSFVLVLILSTLICLVLSGFNFNQSGNLKEFFGNNLAHWRFLPNHYMGMYVSFALLILAGDFIKPDFSLSGVGKWKIVAFIYLLFFLVLLAVRIQLVALPMAFAIMFWSEVKEAKKRLKGTAVLTSVFVLFTLAVMLFPNSRRRVLETFDEFKSIKKEVNDKQTNHRVFIWRDGLKVIRENFWFGTGVGSADDELGVLLAEEKAKFWDGKHNYFLGSGDYNYHNQFLQFSAATGLVGMLFGVGIFVFAFVWAYQNEAFIGVGFLVLCAISFFTESMLERQAGVLFFTFFFGLLIINQSKTNQKLV